MTHYTKEQLELFNLLDQPVWVFDIGGNVVWWANSIALELWNAESFDELATRDFSATLRKKDVERAHDDLKRMKMGEKIKGQRIFCPRGRGITRVETISSGIKIDQGNRWAVLVQGVIVKNSPKEHGCSQTQSYDQTRAFDMQGHERASNLLCDIFPADVAEALQEGRKVDPIQRDEVTLFFSDIVGFTSIAARLTPMKVANMLDRLYQRFDLLSRAHNVYKVETIGDAYVAATNLVCDQPQHSQIMVAFAQATIQAANSTLIDVDRPQLGCISIRVGLHAGPVVATVIGSRNPRFCLFGDTVNVASRMESSSEENRIQSSESMAELLKAQAPMKNTFIKLEPRGTVPIKGKGEMTPFWVEVNTPKRTRGEESHASLHARAKRRISMTLAKVVR